MIYLMRHADAEPDSGEGDAARELTGKGRKQATAAGRAISRLGWEIETCLASPRARARQTAELACRALGLEVETVASLGEGPIDAPELATGRGTTLIVGHQPYLAAEIARLTGAECRMKKGGIAALEPGRLSALLRPAELAAIAAGR